MTLLQELESRLSIAVAAAIGEPAAAPVTPVADLRFGDYQSNAAMVLAKQRKTNPRALAQAIIDQVDLSGLATAEIAGWVSQLPGAAGGLRGAGGGVAAR